ncbi:hypothetical protein [Halalkalibaculum roseum]|nr:hypothetical protein [Halalkalibaculum roseum]
MIWVKTALLSLVYFITYVAFTGNNSHEVTSEKPEGHVVDNFSIEELIAEKKADYKEAPIASLKLRSTWIYEKGAGITPEGSIRRNYSDLFSHYDSRFICWEITLEHPSYDTNRNLDFTFQLFDQAGNQVTKNKADSWIPANSEFSDHSACWGWPYPNNWSPGKYTFDVKTIVSSSSQSDDFSATIDFTMY